MKTGRWLVPLIVFFSILGNMDGQSVDSSGYFAKERYEFLKEELKDYRAFLQQERTEHRDFLERYY